MTINKRNQNAIPNVPTTITDPGLRQFLESVRTSVQTFQGGRTANAELDRAVTLRELTEGKVNLNRKAVVDAILAGDSGSRNLDGLFDTAVDTPPKPSGFEVAVGFEAAVLRWDLPTYKGHSHTEIFRQRTELNSRGAPVDKPQFDEKKLLRATSIGVVESDAVDYYSGYYYWIRHVNRKGIQGPLSSTEGLFVKTSRTIEDEMKAAGVANIKGFHEVPTEYQGTDTIYIYPLRQLFHWDGKAYTRNIPIEGIPDGAIGLSKFARGLAPVGLYDKVPTEYVNTDVIYNSTDGKLYRWDGEAYTAKIMNYDLVGKLTNEQIESIEAAKIAGEIDTAKLTGILNIAHIPEIPTSKVTGILKDSQLPKVPAAKITGQLVDDQIAKISAVKISGQLVPETIPNIDINKVIGGIPAERVVGELPVVTIPNIDINKVIGDLNANRVKGELVPANIPKLDMAKITSGVLSAARISGELKPVNIPSIDIGKITGNLEAARITGELKPVNIPIINVDKLSGQIPDSKILGVSASKLSGQLPLVNLPLVPTDKLKGTVNANQIAANAIGANNIQSDAIQTKHIKSGSVTTDLLSVGTGGNLLTNPTLANNAHGYGVVVNLPKGLTRSDVSINYRGNDLTEKYRLKEGVPNEVCVAVTYRGTFDNDINSWSDVVRLNNVNVTAGKHYIFSGYFNPYRAHGHLRVEAVNEGAANTYVASSKTIGATIGGRTAVSAGGFENGLQSSIRTFVKFTAPASGVVMLSARLTGFTGTSPVAFFARPQLEEVGEHVTEPSAWKVGGVTAIHGGSVIADTLNADRILSKSITAAQIAAGAITADEIKTKSIQTDHIAANAVTANEILTNSIRTTHIAVNAVTANEIAANAVTAAKILAESITAIKLATDSVTANKIKAGAVNADKIAANAVTAGKIDVNAIEAKHVATGALTADKILVGSQINLIPNGAGEMGGAYGWASGLTWDTVDKPAGEIGSFKSAVGQGTYYTPRAFFDVVGGDEYLFEIWVKASKPGSRLYVELRDNDLIATTNTGTGASGGYPFYSPSVPTTWTRYAVTSTVKDGVSKLRVAGIYFNHPQGTEQGAQIAIAGMRYRPKSAGELIVDGSIIASKIATDAITADKIATNAVTAAKILAGTIDATRIKTGTLTAKQLAAEAITTGAIATNAITSTKIEANAVTASKILAGSIVTEKLATNAVTTAKINAGAVTANEIASKAIIAGKIDTNAVTAGTIAANAITAREIKSNEIETEHLKAGAITASRLAVIDTSNRILNPTFNDVGTAGGWSGADWRVTEINGTRWLVSDNTKTAASNSDYINECVSPTFAVNPGEQYFISVRSFVSGNTLLSSPRPLCSVSGTNWVTVWPPVISASNNGANIGPTPANGVEQTMVVQIPAGCNFMRFRSSRRAPAIGATSSGVVRITNPYVRLMANADLVVDGAVTAQKIATKAIQTIHLSSNIIEADHIKTGAVSADKIDVNAVTANKIASNAVTAVKIAANAITSDKVAANSITASKIVMSGGNLIKDGNFDDPACWTVGLTQSNTDGKATVVPAPSAFKRPGENALRVVMTRDAVGSTTTFGWGVTTAPENTPAERGRYLRLSCEVIANSDFVGTVGVYVEVLDADNNGLGTAGGGLGIVLKDVDVRRKGLMTLTATAPNPLSDNAAKIRCYLRLGATANGGPCKGTVFFCAPRMTYMADAELIVDGAITADKLEAKAIKAEAIDTKAILAQHLNSGIITGEHIAVDTITTGHIRAGAINADQIAAGQLTADKFAVGVGGNLLVNPIFAEPTDGIPFGWGRINYYNGTIGTARQPYLVDGGVVTYLENENSVHQKSLNTNLTTNRCTFLYQDINVVVGQWYIASAYVSVHRMKARMRIEQLSASTNAYVSTVVNGAYVTAGGNVMRAQGLVPETRVYVKFKAPASGRIRFAIEGVDNTATTDQQIFIMRPQLEQCTEHTKMPGSWNLGGVTVIHGGSLVNDSITTGKIAANTIGAKHIITDSILAKHIKGREITGDKIAASQTFKAPVIDGGEIRGTNITATNTITGAKISGVTVTGATILGGRIESNTTIVGAHLEGATGKFTGELEVTQLIGGGIFQRGVAPAVITAQNGGVTRRTRFIIPASRARRVLHLTYIGRTGKGIGYEDVYYGSNENGGTSTNTYEYDLVSDFKINIVSGSASVNLPALMATINADSAVTIDFFFTTHYSEYRPAQSTNSTGWTLSIDNNTGVTIQ